MGNSENKTTEQQVFTPEELAEQNAAININPEENDERDKEDETEDEGKETVYPTTIHYLNEVHGLNLNVAELEGISKEEEYQVVSDLFETIIENAEAKIEEYSQVAQLLEDPEVVEFLQFKANGGSLLQLKTGQLADYSSISDEDIAFNMFKKANPKLEDDEVLDMIQTYKNTGKLKSFADKGREVLRDEKIQELEAREQQKRLEEKRALEKEREIYEQELSKYATLVKNTPDIAGVPLTPKMKELLVQAVAQVDRNGDSWLEKQLETPEGTLRAALGIMFLEQLVSASKTIAVSKENKALTQRLFTNPSQLQSNKKVNKKELVEQYITKAADRF